jgi:hypothetical protein
MATTTTATASSNRGCPTKVPSAHSKWEAPQMRAGVAVLVEVGVVEVGCLR